MSIVLDASKTGRENFFDLIALSNPVAQYAEGRVTVSQPVVNEVSQKTEVTLTAIPGQGFTDEVTVNYDRVNPVVNSGTLLKGPVIVSPEDDQETILQKILTHHHLIGEEVDVIGTGPEGSFLIPRWSDDEDPSYGYQIFAKQESLVYQDNGEPFVGTFFCDNPFESLSTAIAVTDLGGFI